MTAAIEPAKLASGTEIRAPMPSVAPKVMAIIAPSEAPAETPSVNGVASGFRSSAWNTTPAPASVAPTIAAASTRGRRAMKKICASALSANGIAASKRAAHVDGRAARERRQHAGRHRQRAEPGERETEPPPDGWMHRRRERCGRHRGAPARRTGITVR